MAKMEAHKIRAYFQEGCEDYNFVVELYRRFPEIIEKETDDFVDSVNNRRERIGLNPVKI